MLAAYLVAYLIVEPVADHVEEAPVESFDYDLCDQGAYLLAAPISVLISADQVPNSDSPVIDPDREPEPVYGGKATDPAP